MRSMTSEGCGTLAIGRLPVVSWVSYLVPWFARGGLSALSARFSPRRLTQGGSHTRIAWLRPCILAKRLIETTGLAGSG